MRFRLLALISALLLSPAAPAPAAEALRFAVQASGTTQWELAVVSALKLDQKAGLDLKLAQLASTEAGKIALMSAGADVIVSDWLYVARERADGARLLFAPASTAIGAVMTKGASIKSVKDLAGKKLGVAGGPLDKSFLLLKAFALRQGVDLESEATLVYGAPPLLAAKLEQGELDAALEFWNFALDLESKGFSRAIDMRDVEKALGAKGDPVVTGYVFAESFAQTHAPALARFLAMMKEARALVAKDDDAWRIAAAKIPAKDKATLDLYRKRYVEGLPQDSAEQQEADAALLFATLAKLGGVKLAGPATTLDLAMFYKAPR